MITKNKRLIIAFLSIFLVLLADQWLKIYVKLNFHYYEEVRVLGNWFSLLFVENRGMAFGMEIPFLSPVVAKIILSSFRIVAVFLIGRYLYKLIQRKVATGLIFSVAMVFSGALGNIIDSTVYGLVFSESEKFSFIPAQMVPFGEGYAQFLTGNVVDMLRFDLFTIDLPFYGTFNFFAPIFNIADTAISFGVFYILLFQRNNFQIEILGKKNNDSLDEFKENQP
jgi:signal peptidase II